MGAQNISFPSEVEASKTLSGMRLVLVGLVALSVLSAAVWFIITQSFTNWDFRNNLWGPTHLLLTGRSPYIISQLFTGSNSVWLPTSIGAYLPLGLLPEAQATNLWALITPYAWSWDFVLLVPLLVQTLFALKNGLLKLAFIAGYGLCIYLMIALRLSSDNNDWLFWWVPWLLMAWVVAMTTLNRQRSTKVNPIPVSRSIA